MPRHRSNQQQCSAPPSPICSDTVSLPDATSDLDNLSDYSGLSISDEDDKHSRSNTESDVEQFSDGDFDEITHSMLASSNLRPSAPTSVKDQSTSTSTTDVVDPEKTPSASFNRGQRPSPLLNKRISASDLAYPTLSQSTDTDNIFGLNLNSIYKQFDEERTISQDQDLIGYSILDTQGESFRKKYERSVQTELEDSTIDDSADTLSELVRSTIAEFTHDDSDNPFVSGGWPTEVVAKSESDQIENRSLLSREDAEGDETSLLANGQRCGPRWLNKQTIGIFGVVLLGVAAYHVKTAPWLSIDTNGLFLNTSSVIVSDSSATFIVTTADLPLHKAPVTTIPPVGTDKVVASPSSTAQVTSFRKPNAERSDTEVSFTHNEVAFPSIPSSVSALISIATSGIASLSTHVASAPSLGDCNKSGQYHDIVASRQQGHRCSRNTDRLARKDLAPSDVRPPGHFPYGAAALSGLPRKAQRGLLTLTASIARHDRHVQHEQERKKQGSRRTGKHWVEQFNQKAPSELDKDIIGEQTSADTQAAHSVAADKAVQAPFSRLSAHKFWNGMPYRQAVRAKGRHSLTLADSNELVPIEEQHLFLESASALSRLSFGNLCKQLDNVLLPFAQHIVDSLNSLDYTMILEWIRNTANECYRIIAPHVAKVDACSKKHVTEWKQEVKNAASFSVAQTEGLYSDAKTYLHYLQAPYKPVVHQYKIRALKKVKEATKLAERASKVSVKKVYVHSKATVGKASKNARKIFRRPGAVGRQVHKKHKKHHKVG